jgi:Fe-S cluster assembly iron-binding protein IscA
LALALDESKEEDEKHEVQGLTFLINPEVAKVLENYKGVDIDFKDYPWGGQIVVKASTGADASECC